MKQLLVWDCDLCHDLKLEELDKFLRKSSSMLKLMSVNCFLASSIKLSKLKSDSKLLKLGKLNCLGKSILKGFVKKLGTCPKESGKMLLKDGKNGRGKDKELCGSMFAGFPDLQLTLVQHRQAPDPGWHFVTFEEQLQSTPWWEDLKENLNIQKNYSSILFLSCMHTE